MNSRNAKPLIPWHQKPTQSIKDACAITNRSQAQLYRDIQRGEFDLVKLGTLKSAVTTESIVRFFEKRGVSVRG